MDLHKYSMVVGVPTWVANIEAGDCLFVPRGWLHQGKNKLCRGPQCAPRCGSPVLESKHGREHVVLTIRVRC